MPGIIQKMMRLLSSSDVDRKRRHRERGPATEEADCLRSDAQRQKDGTTGGAQVNADSYSQRAAGELSAFEGMTNVHDLPRAHHYWSNKYLLPKLQLLGVRDFWALFVDPIVRLWRQSGRVIQGRRPRIGKL